ncbi:MAG: DUF2178 domain-containing protein [Gammaproteobacteria bacterium]|nr:DUF2178 domain-containing protein [Gammaproteobacteria bacterium]NNF60458.1 DUF2178 domain-containing protein [Gammaproteobacteria bacterium]
MSFQEKSIVASFVTTALVWGYYFSRVYDFSTGVFAGLAGVGMLLLAAVALTIILEIVVQAFIVARAALANESADAPPEDERDKAILYRASYFSAYILFFGVIATVIIALATESLVIALNTLILHFVGAELWRYLLQLYYYRRGM